MRVVTPYPNVPHLLTGHERRGPSWCWRPRGTPTQLLLYTRSGGGLVRTAGTGAEHQIRTGDSVVWAAGAPQDFGCRDTTEPWEIVWAHFHPREHWHDLLGWPLLGAGVARMPAPPRRMRERIDAALLEMDASAHSPSPHAVDFAFNALERGLLWLDAANPEAARLDDRLHDAILFIARRLGGRLSVAGVADAVQLSPSRLSHLFTEQLGMPPARFIELRRIERARTLLESSSMPIGAVAGAAGFSSQFYFATRFKALVGVTPSDWRRRAIRGGSRR